MSNIPKSLEELIAAAEQHSNQAENTSTSFERTVPDEGPVVMRFIEYIELGPQKQRDFAGKKKPDCLEAVVTFELLNKARIRDVEVEGVQKQFTDIISNTYQIKLNEKSNFRKLWNAMTYGRDVKHMLRMIGEPFKGNIKHNVKEGKDGKEDRTYANLQDASENIGIYAPFLERLNEDGEPVKEKLSVRENIRPIRIFLWDNPTKETWDSLFIDGTSERKNAAGETVQVSKNWLQEKILSSPAYSGSALEALVGGLDTLSLDPSVQPAEQEATPVEDNPLEGVGQTSPLQPVVAPPAAAKAKSNAPQPAVKKVAPAPTKASADLAALGLE